MKHIYTMSALPGGLSTCQRQLARISPAYEAEPARVQAIPRPFSVWTEEGTEGGDFRRVPAVIVPTQTAYVTVHRARNNRRARKALTTAKMEALAV